MSVVLPAPEGPMMVTNSPCPTSRLIRRNSQIVPAGDLIVFSIPRNSIIFRILKPCLQERNGTSDSETKQQATG